MVNQVAPQLVPAMVEYCLRLGDDRLILGHRTSEWCGHGPMLEEDVALANISLDLIGAANHLLALAGRLEGKGRSEDALAFGRDDLEYRCCALVEQPNGDYAVTIVRHALFSAFTIALAGRLASSPVSDLAGIMGKCLKEAHYHFRHTSEWLLRFGNGTEESHARAQAAVDQLWRFTGELFQSDTIERELHAAKLVPLSEELRSEWLALIEPLLKQSNLRQPPPDTWMVLGARSGRHTEHLGHLLAEMQSVTRNHPGASW